MKGAKLKPFDAVAAYCKSRGYPVPVAEVRFAPPRRWRWDAAWGLPHMIAVEFQGGVWTAGRHTRGKGYSDDCTKYATAAVMGWRLLPVTTEQLQRGDLWPMLDTLFSTGRPRR